MPTFLRWLRLILVVAILLLSVWFGIKEGLDGFRGAETTPQRVAGVTQILYGFAAVAALGAFVIRRPWLSTALGSWVVTVTLTATMAPIVWGGAGWMAGALAGLATAVVAGLTTWGALAHVGR